MNSKKNDSLRLILPDWRNVLTKFIDNNKNHLGKSKFESTNALCAVYTKRCDETKKRILNYHPIDALAILNQYAGEYISGSSLNEITGTLDKVKLGLHEFYSVYDIPNFKYINIDKKINDILGISEDQFTMTALCGLEADNPLFHIEDVNHVIRWGNIAYMVASLPGIKFRLLDDFYRVQFRINVSKSKIPSIREKEYVTLEKRCYLSNSGTDAPNMRPRYHLDRWTVFDKSEFKFVNPKFVSSDSQANYMNSLAYIFNAHLIGIPIKNILLLNLRTQFDRNKAIANAFNEKIGEHSTCRIKFSETQVADCFAKTVRKDITKHMRAWTKNPDFPLIESDQDSSHFAQTLGLLPIPKDIEVLCYQLMYDV